MRLKDENPELNGIVKSYNLRGFSFREYMNLLTGSKLPIYGLDDILEHHEEIATKIIGECSDVPEYSAAICTTDSIPSSSNTAILRRICSRR